MIRIALLSRWHVHADDYWREAAAIPGAEITCVWDEDPRRGAQWAEELGLPFEPELDALLARADVDAVMVTCATTLHREVLIKAARAGKHIFTEKVLAPTVAEALDIAREVEQSGVKFAISTLYKAKPEYLFAKQCVDEGRLGQITCIRICSAHDGGSEGWLPQRFFDPAEAGGGAMLDLGAHPMYLSAWLLGMPRSVSSTFTSVGGHRVEDNAVSVMDYDSGAIFISQTSFVSMPRSRYMEVMGTKGSLRMDAPMGDTSHLPIRMELYTESGAPCTGWVQPESLPAVEPGAVAQWIGAIQHGSPVAFGMESALELTALMQAAYQSHQEDKRVFLNDTIQWPR